MCLMMELVLKRWLTENKIEDSFLRQERPDIARRRLWRCNWRAKMIMRRLTKYELCLMEEDWGLVKETHVKKLAYQR